MFTLDPLAPTNFNITKTFEENLNISVQFEWGSPLGSGPEFVVDGYQLSVTAETDSVDVNVTSDSWNMTLDYNVEYSASISSVNCVGESSRVLLHNVLFGK